MNTDSDTELRRASPAYRPDDDWEQFEPQSMQVVLSVRLDARAARRVASAARAAGQSPSRLVRGWIHERLATGDAVHAGVREAPIPYGADSADYERLRDRYRPDRIDVLLVGESRPAGGSFFYRANSNLFYATHEAFQRAFGTIPSAAGFLDYLRDQGVWLYDLADVPIDRMRGRPRRSAVQARTSDLVALLHEANPRRVVVIKRDLGPTVRQALEAAGVPLDRLVVLPFPLYQWRAEYVRGLAAVVAGRESV